MCVCVCVGGGGGGGGGGEAVARGLCEMHLLVSSMIVITCKK